MSERRSASEALSIAFQASTDAIRYARTALGVPTSCLSDVPTVSGGEGVTDPNESSSQDSVTRILAEFIAASASLTALTARLNALWRDEDYRTHPLPNPQHAGWLTDSEAEAAFLAARFAYTSHFGRGSGLPILGFGSAAMTLDCQEFVDNVASFADSLAQMKLLFREPVHCDNLKIADFCLHRLGATYLRLPWALDSTDEISVFYDGPEGFALSNPTVLSPNGLAVGWRGPDQVHQTHLVGVYGAGVRVAVVSGNAARSESRSQLPNETLGSQPQSASDKSPRLPTVSSSRCSQCGRLLLVSPIAPPQILERESPWIPAPPVVFGQAYLPFRSSPSGDSSPHKTGRSSAPATSPGGGDTLGSRIKVARKRQCLSRHRLALRLGYNTQGWTKEVVRDWETGAKEPSFRSLRDLSRELRVSIAWLRGEEEP